MPCGSQAHHSIRRLAPLHHKSKHGLTVSVPVHSSLGCPCRDVGEAIPVGSLRPIRTARKTLGGHTLERPSCGGFMPTAETTLIPAYMTDECTYQPKSLTRSARSSILRKGLQLDPKVASENVGNIFKAGPHAHYL